MKETHILLFANLSVVGLWDDGEREEESNDTGEKGGQMQEENADSTREVRRGGLRGQPADHAAQRLTHTVAHGF